MHKISKKEFSNTLTSEIENALLKHFNTIYVCKTLTEHEYKIVYLAYLWKSGYVYEIGDGWLDINKEQTGVDIRDYELTFEVDESETGGTNLYLTYEFYDLDKIIKIITNDFLESIVSFCEKQYANRLITSSFNSSKHTLFLQLSIGADKDSLFYPFVNNENYQFDKANGTGFDIISFDINITGNINCYMYGYLPDGIVEDPEFQNHTDNCFKLRITQPEELQDIIDFITEVVINDKIDLNSKKIEIKNLETNFIIDSTFIFIPFLNPKLLSNIKINNKLSIEDIYELFQKIKYPSTGMGIEDDFKEKIRKNDKKKEEFKVIFSDLIKGSNYNLEIGDILVEIKFDKKIELFGYYDVYNSNLFHSLEMFYVFRLKPKTSYLAFYDYLCNTIEGDNLLSNLFDTNNLPKYLCYSLNKFKLIQFTLENLVNKESLKYKMNNLIVNKENFEFKNNLTKNRIKYLSAFYETQHKLVEIFENPLPYVIEDAFRSFVKSDSDMESATKGSHILNILIKTRVLFPLEEYIKNENNANNDFNNVIKQTLFSDKKPSDGTYNQLFIDFSKFFNSNQIKLECFNHFYSILNNTNIDYLILEIIESRNRFAHPPYLINPYIETLNRNIPKLIQFYRDSMINIYFLIPESFIIQNQKIILTAKKLMGFENKLDSVKIEISQDQIYNFEVGKLIAWNSETKGIVQFENFFKIVPKNDIKWEIGIYDRFEKGLSIFEF
jgi:hypothetical protein